MPTTYLSPEERSQEEAQAKMNQMLAFLRIEKDRAQDRIRQCQTLLNDPHLDAICPTNCEVRESLEAVRNNAEDDIGHLLHLITVLSSKKTSVGGGGGGILNPLGDVTSDQDVSHSMTGPSGDFGGSTLGPAPGVDIVPQREKRNNPLENWDPLKNDDDLVDNEVSDKILPENDEEREEDEDYVPQNLIQPSGRSISKGRFIASSASSSSRQNLARSLPVTVPVNTKRDWRNMPNLPKEIMDKKDVEPEEILESMVQIAKSLHVDKMGERPQPNKIFTFDT